MFAVPDSKQSQDGEQGRQQESEPQDLPRCGQDVLEGGGDHDDDLQGQVPFSDGAEKAVEHGG